MNTLMTLANPFTNDPRVYQEARTFSKEGHKVTVLAWDGKGQNPPKDVKDGIDVFRIRNTRFMDFLPYDILRLRFWRNEAYKEALKLHKRNPFDVLHCHDLDTLPIGIKLKKKLGLPLIYDAHEIWGYMVMRDFPKLLIDYFFRKEKRLIKHVDRVITVNEPLRGYFSKISNKPITIVMNCKPLQGTEYEQPKNDRFTLIYIGTLGPSRFLIELADIIKEMPNVYCKIGGAGKSEYVDALKRKCSDIPNVDFVGKVPFEQVLPMTKKADAIACMTDPKHKNNSSALANKQFEALVCGRPIICTKNTYPGQFTEQHSVGITVDFSKEGLRKGIELLRDRPDLCEQFGRRALEKAIIGYNWEAQGEKLLNVYNLMVKGKG